MNLVYHSILSETSSEFSDRGSRFLGYAFPVTSAEDAKAKLQGVKKEHPKASHHCFAWRVGQQAEIHRVSDDGEPSGSAGRPILGQIQSLDLTNVMVVVVRYFGGTMLGIPGLINAYKTTAADALGKAGRISKNIEQNVEITCDYTVMNEVMTLFKQYEVTIMERDQLLFCRFRVGVPLVTCDAMISKLEDIRGVEIKRETEG